MYRVRGFVANDPVLLIDGALLALIWANIDPHSYHDVVEFIIVDDFIIGHAPRIEMRRARCTGR